MSHETQATPDVAFLRNTGAVLLGVTVLVGAISIGGCFFISVPGASSKLAYSEVPTMGMAVPPSIQDIEHHQ